MEWFALVIWLLVAAIGAPLALTGLFVSPALALQALLGVGGLALCVLYIALGGGSALAWGSAAAAGLACCRPGRDGRARVRQPARPRGRADRGGSRREPGRRPARAVRGRRRDRGHGRARA